MINLDNHTTTEPCSAALEKAKCFLYEDRTSFIYDLLGADEKARFSFAGVGEVFWSVFVEKARKEGKCHIIVFANSDRKTLLWAKRLEELGCFVKVASDVEQLEQLISPRTALVSIAIADGRTGLLAPFEEVLEIAKKHNVLCHIDAGYAAGKFRFSLDADYVTFQGKMIHALGGEGVFIKPGAPWVEPIGKVDVPVAMSLTAAAQQALMYVDTMMLEVARLRDLFEELCGGTVLHKEEMRLPNVSAMKFPVHDEALLYKLERNGILCKRGSFALSRMTTEEEIRKAAAIVRAAVEELCVIGGDLVKN